MLFSNFYVQSLLLFGMQSVVMGDPIPYAKGHIQERDVTSDLILIKGGPEFLALEERSLELDDDLDSNSGATLSTDQTQALNLHNTARAGKKLPALVWSDTLTVAANAWATILAANNTFVHSPSSSRPGQGENLAYGWSSGPISDPITQGTKEWLAEATNYHNEVIPQGAFASYGHYTQIMWNGTTAVGISTVQSKRGGYYTVARYSPAGNIVGKKAYSG